MESQPALEEGVNGMPMPVETQKRPLPPGTRRKVASDRGSKLAALRESFGLKNPGRWEGSRYIPGSTRGEGHFDRNGTLKRRDPGSVEAKLKTAYGGKAAKQIIQQNRHAMNADPNSIVAIVPHENDSGGDELVRGHDFVIVTGRPGSPFLLLRDGIEPGEVKLAVDDSAFPSLGFGA